MAKILTTPVVGAVSGKVAAVVFTTNKSGPYVKLKAPPSHPLTPPSHNIRIGLKGLSVAWGWLLSSDQRADWIAWASDPAHTVLDVFLNSIYLTGLNWYVLCNMNIKSMGLPRMDDIPPVWTVTDPASCDVQIGGPPYVLTLNPLIPPGANDHAVVLAAPPTSPGVYYIGKKWRIQQKFGAGVAGPYDITDKYETKFGALQAGQTINCQMMYIDDRCGRQSAKVADSAVVP